jgi:hypothetical protein
MLHTHPRPERSVQAIIYNDPATISAKRHSLMYETIDKENVCLIREE